MTKIAIVTAVWKRPEIFALYVKGIRALLEEFPEIDFEIIVAGSEGKKTAQMVKKEAFHYVEMPNDPLASKHNASVEKARQLNCDYVLCLGSDDIISPGVFKLYLDQLEQEKYDFIGLTDFYFYDHPTGKAAYWGGYIDHRKGYFCGAGILLSRRLLNAWNWKPWSDMHSAVLDDSIAIKLKLTPHKKKLLSLKDHNLYAVDIKSSTNMTPFELWPNTVEIDPKILKKQFDYL